MDLKRRLREPVLIPAHPLALEESLQLDIRAQRALSRYYLDAGANGLAVGVHTTQFELHYDRGMLCEVWGLARDEAKPDTILVAGVAGETAQAVEETRLARELGYHCVLLTAWGVQDSSVDHLLDRAQAVGEVLPVIGFYLQESVDGIYLPPSYWTRLFEQESVVAVKFAPFNRYRTNESMRALIQHDRWNDVAVLTGNDDAIVTDLVTPLRWRDREVRATGGLLGQWAVGTAAARELLDRVAAAVASNSIPTELLSIGADITEINAVVFDVVHNFAGSVPGVNEVLRQQGLVPTSRCLGPDVLSPGQSESLKRARAQYPGLFDEDFVAVNRERWLAD